MLCLEGFDNGEGVLGTVLGALVMDGLPLLVTPLGHSSGHGLVTVTSPASQESKETLYEIIDCVCYTKYVLQQRVEGRLEFNFPGGDGLKMREGVSLKSVTGWLCENN